METDSSAAVPVGSLASGHLRGMYAQQAQEHVSSILFICKTSKALNDCRLTDETCNRRYMVEHSLASDQMPIESLGIGRLLDLELIEELLFTLDVLGICRLFDSNILGVLLLIALNHIRNSWYIKYMLGTSCFCIPCDNVPLLRIIHFENKRSFYGQEPITGAKGLI